MTTKRFHDHPCQIPFIAIAPFLLITFGWSALKGNLFTEPFPFSSLPSLFVALGLTAIKGQIDVIPWESTDNAQI
jgi:uncharacterized protein